MLVWLATYLRLRLFKFGFLRSQWLPYGKTISVGNIAYGGTGKTPVVIAICERLVEIGSKPVIVTRGYKSGLKSDEMMVILGGNVVFSTANSSKKLPPRPDEAFMQSAKLPEVPVVVGANRVRAVEEFLRRAGVKPTHWILDDGFQHFRIKRHLDLVLLDAREPQIGGSFLPKGLLRESPTALKRARACMLTRAERVEDSTRVLRLLRRYTAGVVFEVPFSNVSIKSIRPTTTKKQLCDFRSVVLITGISKPERLEESLTKLNINICNKKFFSDHGRISIDENELGVSKNSTIFTTEKDYFRDPAVFDRLECDVYILQLKVSLPDEFISLLLNC